jgi:hypothetical protein
MSVTESRRSSIDSTSSSQGSARKNRINASIRVSGNRGVKESPRTESPSHHQQVMNSQLSADEMKTSIDQVSYHISVCDT